MNAKIPMLAVPQEPLTDSFQRALSYVRLSITDLCNFKCTYCLPNGYQGKKNPNELSVNEISVLVRALADLGVKKIRITGGEPSLRPDLPDIIACIKETSGIEKVALTTNGYRLSEYFPAWQKAGLDALNVSIDSFDPATFAQITGVDLLPELLHTLDVILATGFRTLKINAVLMQNTAHHVLNDALDYIQQRPVSVRFIELMQTADHADLFFKEHISAQYVTTQLQQQGFTAAAREYTAGPALHYTHPNYAGNIGIIAPYQPHFCSTCNRVRVTSQGRLHLCLYDSQAYDLRPLLQPQQLDVLKQTLTQWVGIKPQAHHLHQGDSGLIRHLSQIGG